MPISSLLLCAGLAFQAAQTRPVPSEASEEASPEHRALLQVESWQELVARDRRLSFGLRTAPSAVAELERRDSGEARQAAALLALGEAQVVAERPRIEHWIAEGKGDVRGAAMWALGALRSPADAVRLANFADRKTASADAAALALAINGTPAALRELETMAADPQHPSTAAAGEALAFARDRASESRLARRYLEVRFEAARLHGLVDGQAWEVVLLSELARNQRFLGRVVYRAAGELRQPGIRDHFLELVLTGELPERMRGAVIAMPTELAQLIDAELYSPADLREWAAMITEIDRRKVEALTEPILRRAYSIPNLRAQAAVLLARGGAAGALQLLDVNLQSVDPDERATAAFGLGASGDESYLPNLAALEDDEALTVRAASLVARARLGDDEGLALLRKQLGLGGDAGQRLTLDETAAAHLDATLRAGTDPKLRELLRELLERVPEALKARVAAELVLGGFDEAKAVVRDRLEREAPRGEIGARIVAACARNATGADVARMRSLFPVGDDVDVDVELACALLREKDAETVPLLRAALWSEPWNRGVLAGALWISVAGVEGLRLELERPPGGVSPRDLRRVGFALGEWGGMGEVERLSARVSPADPALQGAVLGALGARTH